ncbi:MULTISPECIES: heavy metal-associated domain-containing protein [unclassified Staphylococcus]|uniref:putative copper chaperone CsoZ n=1 Tax=unclassified Staphylococcus TaxID=91994 RepID=UPI0021D1615C|nr:MULTISPECIES: heavy metal-associated domain-containing protein [unclassified Staphylococcus]UXR69122.1 heavy-metal-associated domain-containing protein [Staphylococcus sp. IVB6246]UXR75766.1 heavy-metal-associated domain-containing protein [Staphylococcus sp. IVB6233]UXR79965.1 heavy-metal-associated domain-containing protein [Staphylococcus sp. IVB6218]
MHSKVWLSGLSSEEQKQQLESRLRDMIGVETAEVDIDKQIVILTYETPANLNTLEKEIYDAGYPVINSYKGED